jgi:hypothetical protein
VANLGGTGTPEIAVNETELRTKLEAKLGALAGEACTMRLNMPLDGATRLQVYLERTKVNRDPTRTEGWEFDPSAPRKVTFYGTWCERLRTSQVDEIYVETCR